MTKQQCVIYLLFWSICPNNGCLKIEWWVCDLLYTKRQLTFSSPSHWKKGPFFKGILDRTMFFVWLLKEIGKLRKLPAFSQYCHPLQIRTKTDQKRFSSYQLLNIFPLFSTCSTFPSHSTILKFLEKISMHLINLKSAMSNSSPTFIPKLRLMCSTYKVKRLLQN